MWDCTILPQTMSISYTGIRDPRASLPRGIHERNRLIVHVALKAAVVFRTAIVWTLLNLRISSAAEPETDAVAPRKE